MTADDETVTRFRSAVQLSADLLGESETYRELYLLALHELHERDRRHRHLCEQYHRLRQAFTDQNRTTP